MLIEYCCFLWCVYMNRVSQIKYPWNKVYLTTSFICYWLGKYFDFKNSALDFTIILTEIRFLLDIFDLYKRGKADLQPYSLFNVKEPFKRKQKRNNLSFVIVYEKDGGIMWNKSGAISSQTAFRFCLLSVAVRPDTHIIILLLFKSRNWRKRFVFVSRLLGSFASRKKNKTVLVFRKLRLYFILFCFKCAAARSVRVNRMFILTESWF